MICSEIIGFGRYAPQRRVLNAEIEERLKLERGWIERRTGILERRYAADGEALTDMAAAAGEEALATVRHRPLAHRTYAARDQHARPPAAAVGAAARAPPGPRAFRRHRPRGRVRRLPLRAGAGRRVRARAKRARAGGGGKCAVAAHQSGRTRELHPLCRRRGRAGAGADRAAGMRAARREPRGGGGRLRPDQDRSGRQPPSVRTRHAGRGNPDDHPGWAGGLLTGRRHDGGDLARGACAKRSSPSPISTGSFPTRPTHASWRRSRASSACRKRR